MSSANHKNIWVSILSLAAFVTAGTLLGYLAWKYIPPLLPEINQTTYTVLAGAVSSLLTFLITKALERRKEIELEHRKQKTPLYEEFIGFLFKVLQASKSSEVIPEAEMTESVMRFIKGLTIWGANDVILKFGEFRKGADKAQKPRELMRLIEEVLFSIRADLGHTHRLPTGSILRLIISDLDNSEP